ncbi:3-oxoacyl-[acyl-carrier-protein] reductase domain protein [Dictyocaulus viviparus]|uniref:3-oxoacyl-[acyl-carrier-protein] reductase domain protein n=1 Tax=Dictyocaulus viviparus TaxID=29172 RepID=A0A0D8XMM0_DICVI|nr:3-oxoacyl-[acyl-carrier-protein] reductase domain protein [Dictyocaulus viviparus]
MPKIFLLTVFIFETAIEELYRCGYLTTIESKNILPELQLIAAYAVTKTALLALTKALANGLCKDGIRVNAIAPGVIKTRMSEMLWNSNEDQDERQISETMEIPMGRVGVPEDCAGTVAFLASDDAQYITGETIVVSGGVHARL